MIKTLRPYQQEIVTKLKLRLKETSRPLLLNISVGGGKSLIIAELLLWLESFGYRALCLTLNSTLIKQNHNAYQLQKGNASIYCAGLKSKCCKNLIVFASPHSICQGIRNKDEISQKPFNLIVVDEAHNISFHDSNSMYMRIFNHYGLMAQSSQYSYRIVGLTGTPYRGKNIYIVGDDQFFKEEVATISSSWLINNNYLTAPIFGKTYVDSIDFSDTHVDNMGKFRHKDLEAAIHKDERLTGSIMREVVSIIENNGHVGAFIFAATKRHCEECLRSLPENQSAIITGDTPHEERENILLAAQEGRIKYLISVNCLMVGIDVPSFDVCVWCRPTESLILYIQGIGRVLRLSHGKTNAIVLDYAGNLERHGELDDPIINQALQPKNGDEEYCIPCYDCNTLNKVTARRCIGNLNNKRCDHYFEFKECPSCNEQNDIVSRFCRGCDKELIDPNAKLHKSVSIPLFEFKLRNIVFNVTELTYGIGILIAFCCMRNSIPVEIYQSYFINSKKSINFFYGHFMKPFYGDQKDLYINLNKPKKDVSSYLSALFQQTTLSLESMTILCARTPDMDYKFVKIKLNH